MFTKARLKLTSMYSLFFLIFFWTFSAGLYLVMENFLKGSYITQVKKQHLQNQSGSEFTATNVYLATTAGNIALHQLRTVLLYLNTGLLIVIPGIIWILTGQTLSPLKEAHEREQTFVSDVSHEMKTPLSIMLGEADVVLAKPRKNNEYLSIVKSFQEEVGRLYLLVDNLLLLTRTDQKGLANTFQSVDLVDTVFEVIGSLKSKIKDKNVNIKFDPPTHNIVLKSNNTLIKQLIYNLIDNAVKYNKENGTIIIDLMKSRKVTTIRIKDDGIGISTFEYESIFNRFYRADSSRSVTKGYGLGLAICKSIVDLHHGSIEVKSSIGKGSTFTVLIPNR